MIATGDIGCGVWERQPNVYSTVLKNNFGKWPNGVDSATTTTTTMLTKCHVSVSKELKNRQKHQRLTRSKGNVNTSSSVK